MEILNLTNPFPHTIVYDFYNGDEQKLIWEELLFLNKPGKMHSPEMTGDPAASKNKKAIFLDRLYTDRNCSNILNVNRKIFTLIDHIEDMNISNYLKYSDFDETMVSYYEDGAYYDSHYDQFVISAITTFWEEPKKFSGGDLVFTDFDYLPKMKNNTIIIFPSYVFHKVTPISLRYNDGKSGRYTINQFYSIRQPNI